MSFLDAGGGFFGSGGKSNSGNSETNANTTSNVLDFTDSENAQANISTLGNIKADDSNVNITTTDFGALDAASGIADSAFAFSNAANEQFTSALNSALSTTENAVDSATEVAQSATQDEAARTQQLLILGGVVVAVSVAFIVLRKRGK